MGGSDSDAISLSWNGDEELFDDLEDEGVGGGGKAEPAETNISHAVAGSTALTQEQRKACATAKGSTHRLTPPRQDPGATATCNSGRKGWLRLSIPSTGSIPESVRRGSSSSCRAGTAQRGRVPAAGKLSSSLMFSRLSSVQGKPNDWHASMSKPSSPLFQQLRPSTAPNDNSVSSFTRFYTRQNGVTVPLLIPDKLLHRVLGSGEAKHGATMAANDTYNVQRRASPSSAVSAHSRAAQLTRPTTRQLPIQLSRRLASAMPSLSRSCAGPAGPRLRMPRSAAKVPSIPAGTTPVTASPVAATRQHPPASQGRSDTTTEVRVSHKRKLLQGRVDSECCPDGGSVKGGHGPRNSAGRSAVAWSASVRDIPVSVAIKRAKVAFAAAAARRRQSLVT